MGKRLEAGTRLGRHRVEKLLGAGAMGEAYLATDEVLDVTVVLKVLSDEMLGEAEAFERFKREVLLSRRISHAGVCKVFDLHQEGEVWFLSMDWVEGETLEGILKREQQLPIGEAARIARLICEALSAAHEAGVVHRDLKPANIMMRADRTVSILDFGLASGQGQQRITQLGSFVGTAYYVAPEVAQGETASEKSDLYAVGALLYKMVTGKVPFDAPGLAEVCAAVVRDTATPPSELNPEVEPDLERVIEKAMRKNPEKRYGSVLELRTAIEAASMHLPDSEVEVKPGDRDLDTSAKEMAEVLGYSALLRAQRRKTTLLFSDIVQITPFFDHYGDIEGRKKIHAHNELLFPIIEAHQGRVVKTIGDAIMAFFELPDESLEAAIEMQEALATYNETVTNPAYRIEIRIGINSGAAIVEENDVYGDAVNVAARVSSQAVGGQILVAQPTVDSLELEWEDLRSIGKFPLKGKSAEMEIHELGWRDEETEEEEEEETGEPVGPRPPVDAEAGEEAVAANPTTTQDRAPQASGPRWSLMLLAILLGGAIGGGLVVSGLWAPEATSRPAPSGPPAPSSLAPPAEEEVDPGESPPAPTWRESAVRAMQRRGLLKDDDPALQALLARKVQSKGPKVRARLEAAAMNRIEKIVIDRAFIEAKLSRLDRLAAEKNFDLETSSLSGVLERARQEQKDGRFIRANRLINLAFNRMNR